MSVQSETTKTTHELDETLIDTSIDDAKWILGGVATLGLIVMSLGLFASTLTV